METNNPETAKVQFNPELKVHDDITTWLAEVLDGNMRTVFEYYFDGQELYGRDGRAVGTIFADSLDDAQELTDKNPNLAFELRRRGFEMEEYGEMIAMANDEVETNTMVVVSDFPPELMDSTEDLGGYNAMRKQTMLRVITKDATGRIKIYSQSLDNSNRTALEAIYSYFGEVPEEGELLGQRIHRKYGSEEQEFLVDWLTGVYDRSMSEQFGGRWLGGRQPAKEGNTYDFVCKQEDLLSAYEAQVYLSGKTESLMYSIAAAMRERFEAPERASEELRMWESNGYSLEGTYNEIEQASLRAQANGRSFSGCGLTIDVGQELSTEQSLDELGYGNKSDKETKYSFDKKMHCVVCQPKPKGDEPKKMCGPCGICESCDIKLSKK